MAYIIYNKKKDTYHYGGYYFDPPKDDMFEAKTYTTEGSARSIVEVLTDGNPRYVSKDSKGKTVYSKIVLDDLEVLKVEMGKGVIERTKAKELFKKDELKFVRKNRHYLGNMLSRFSDKQKKNLEPIWKKCRKDLESKRSYYGLLPKDGCKIPFGSGGREMCWVFVVNDGGEWKVRLNPILEELTPADIKDGFEVLSDPSYDRMKDAIKATKDYFDTLDPTDNKLWSLTFSTLNTMYLKAEKEVLRKMFPPPTRNTAWNTSSPNNYHPNPNVPITPNKVSVNNGKVYHNGFVICDVKKSSIIPNENEEKSVEKESTSSEPKENKKSSSMFTEEDFS